MNIATTIEKLSTSISCQEYIKYALHKVESQIQANPTSQNLNKRTKLQKEIDGHASDVSNRREELARLFKLDIIDELVKSNNQMKVANQKQNEAIQTLHGSIEKLETQLNTLERFIPMLLGAIANRSVATPNDFDTNKEGNFGDENGGSNEPASNSSLYRTESESPSGDPVKDTNTSTEVSPALTQSPRKRKRQGSNSENAPKKPVLSYLERVKRGEQDLFETPHKSFTNRMILCKTGQEQLDELFCADSLYRLVYENAIDKGAVNKLLVKFVEKWAGMVECFEKHCHGNVEEFIAKNGDGRGKVLVKQVNAPRNAAWKCSCR